MDKPIRTSRTSEWEYYFNVAKDTAQRSTCRRRQVGAIAVLHKHIIATGYNGAPAGLRDCLELGCLRDELRIPSGVNLETCRAVHAEQNVIIQAALDGRSLLGATIYATHSPCGTCARMLVNAGIDAYWYLEAYSDPQFEQWFLQAGVKFGPRLIEIRLPDIPTS